MKVAYATIIIIQFILYTGYDSLFFPVFKAYMVLKVAKASTFLPCDIRYLGLSGKKGSNRPLMRPGKAVIARKTFHV